jgi:hypothetical protein
MQLADVFLSLGEQDFGKVMSTVSMGRLRTYQMYERLKARAHVHKLNAETLRKVTPRLWARLSEGDEEYTKDLAQAVLVSNLNLIEAVLNFLSIPNEGGFFAKDLDPKQCLADGWQGRVFEEFRGRFPEAVLVFYINHLGWEVGKAEEVFKPAA